jgi:hypothetical protein
LISAAVVRAPTRRTPPSSRPSSLITTYALSQIKQAEAAAASGTAVKPALIPDQ